MIQKSPKYAMDHVLYVLWLTWITWRTSVIGSSTSCRNFMNFQVVSFCFWFYMCSLPFRASFTHKVLTRFLQYSTISTLKLWHLPKKSTALMDFYIGPSQAQLTIMSHVAGISQRFASVALDCSCSCLAVLPSCRLADLFWFFFLWYQASFPSRLDVWKCSWKKNPWSHKYTRTTWDLLTNKNVQYKSETGIKSVPIPQFLEKTQSNQVLHQYILEDAPWRWTSRLVDGLGNLVDV